MLQGSSIPGALRLQRLILQEFGDSLRSKEGGIDRQALAALVYSDRRRLAGLKKVLSPVLNGEISRRIKKTRGLVILESALAAEEKLLPLTNFNVLLVDCSRATRLKRLKNGDLPLRQVLKRISLQFPNHKKARAIQVQQRLAGRGDFFRIRTDKAGFKENLSRILTQLSAHFKSGGLS